MYVAWFGCRNVVWCGSFERTQLTGLEAFLFENGASRRYSSKKSLGTSLCQVLCPLLGISTVEVEPGVTHTQV